MNKKQIISSVTVLVSALVATPALAVTPTVVGASATVNANTNVVTSSTTVRANLQVKRSANLEKIVVRGDEAIKVRIDDLNKLNTRVQGMKNVSAEEKASIASEVSLSIANLNTLKVKLDSDTDVTNATNDEKSIATGHRIYALIMPRGYIYAAADRVKTISALMASTSVKIDARIAEAQTAGKDVTAVQKSLVEMKAKVADANVQASAAIELVASLNPDGGDKTKQQANTTALKSAREKIKIATTDLETARKDLKSIIQALRSMNVKVEGSATSTVR